MNLDLLLPFSNILNPDIFDSHIRYLYIDIL
jgi:hypothetical protein